MTLNPPNQVRSFDTLGWESTLKGTRNSSPWAGNGPKFRRVEGLALGLTLNNFFRIFRIY